MKTTMVISPHADDATLFCGGTLARMSAEGQHVVLVRVTDDRFDSVGLSVEETIERNAAELQSAAHELGVAEIVELGFETDRLADTPETVLRERFVYLLRRYRPHTVLSFDPFQQYEDNQDHVRVAQAVAESFWVSCFDKHHPEHLAEGLEPFAPAEHWFFGRTLPEVNHVVDVTESLEAKVAAALCHETMMRNTVNQNRLQLLTNGRRVALLDAAMHGELRPLLERFLRNQAAAAAMVNGLPDGRFAEIFRKERFGDLDEFFDQLSEKA